MAVEIEAKMKVASLSVVRDRLIAAGAKLVGEFLERNTFFDTEDRSLLAADEGLRVRLNHELESSDKSCKITFKGPRQHGQLKSREETELVVGNYETACLLIERLGYTKVLSFEKRRDTWMLDNCEVDLDEVPHLGTFVEIEGPKDEIVLKVRDTLHLSDRPLVRASYVAMLMTYLQEQGRPMNDVVFTPELAKRRLGA